MKVSPKFVCSACMDRSASADADYDNGTAFCDMREFRRGCEHATDRIEERGPRGGGAQVVPTPVRAASGEWIMVRSGSLTFGSGTSGGGQCGAA